ncbi:MAG: hypothetical protein ABIF82_03220 [Planctomycetota bacterium]
MVRESFPEPELRLDYGRMGNHSPWKNAGAGILHYSYAAPATAGTYAGFDRFGRVKQQFWLDGADTDNDDDGRTGRTGVRGRSPWKNANGGILPDLFYDRLTTLHRGELDGVNGASPWPGRVGGQIETATR